MIGRHLGLLVLFCFLCLSSNSWAQNAAAPFTDIVDTSNGFIDIRDYNNTISLAAPDDSGGNFTIPWEVEMIDGHKVSQGTMYTNGFLSFNTDVWVQYGGCCAGPDLTTGSGPSYDFNQTGAEGMLDYIVAPFWTDWIRASNNNLQSEVLAYYDTSQELAVFGWYEMKEYGNNNTHGSFEVQFIDGNITFAYDRITMGNNGGHDWTIGITGDYSEGYVEQFGHGDPSEFSSVDFSNTNDSFTAYSSVDCSNPLNDTSCSGYQEAYLEQQCTNDPLYDSQCSGYETAYYNQQCDADPLYDSGCSGYDTAYLDQQCTADPLYDTSCPGYETAYYNQQCESDPLYDTGCSGYDTAYYHQQCSNNPLYDTGCSGYQDAYYSQQCTEDSLYDSGCPGYETAYHEQQCNQDSLYNSTCTGYDAAYEERQCSKDSLYSPTCPGYQLAFEDNQCKKDSQWSPSCSGYQFNDPTTTTQSFGFEDFSQGDMGDTGEDFGSYQDDFGGYQQEDDKGKGEPEPEMFGQPEEEEFIFAELGPDEFRENEPEVEVFEVFEEQEDFIFDEDPTKEDKIEIHPLEEFEEIEEAIPEEAISLEELEEEKEEAEKMQVLVEEEEIEEDVVVITETAEESSSSDGAKRTSRSGSRIGLSIGLATADALVAGLISNSIESGTSAAAQGQSSFGGFDSQGFDSTAGGSMMYDDSGMFNQLAGAQAAVSMDSLQGTMTTDEQQSDNVESSLGVSIDLGVGIQILSTTSGMQEVVVITRPKTLAEKIADRTRKQNERNQTGVFANQVDVLEGMAAATDFSKYYNERMADASSWYSGKQIYKGVQLNDQVNSFYRMNSEAHGLMQDMIRSQYD